MGLRAQRKKARNQFLVGDIVTWGRGVVEAPVVAVAADGLYVETKLSDGTPSPRHFVPFLPGQRYGHTMEPPTLVRRPRKKS